MSQMRSTPGEATAELEKYRRVFHAMPDYATFSNLRTGVFIDVNPGFERLIGYTRHEVVGRDSASIGLWVHARDREEVVRQLRTADAATIQTQFRTRSGDILDVEAACSTFTVHDEEMLVAIVRDITSRKRQEQELAQYRTTLEKLVEQRTVALEEAMQKLKELATHDELTGVGNRRDLNAHLSRLHEALRRNATPASIAVFDLDNFKTVNDQFGHAVGDEVIKEFAEIIRKEMRAVDYVARYGGDEFVLLLSGVKEDAIAPLQRIREAVLEHPWARIIPGIHLSASIGVASFDPVETPDDTFRRADKALYKAKLDGRNQIVVAESPG